MSSSSSSGGFLCDVCAVIVKQGVGKARADILSRQLIAKGGAVCDTLTSNVTHILVGNNVKLTRVPHLLKVDSVPEGVSVLRADWLSTCLVEGRKIGHAQYTLSPHLSPEKLKTTTSPIAAAKTSPVKVSPSVKNISPLKELSIGSPEISHPSSPEVSYNSLKESPESSHDPSEVSLEDPKKSLPSMTSPKAGMFRVAERRWKITMEPHRAKGRWEDADSDSDSDSDYTHSGDEEEAKEEKEKLVAVAKKELEESDISAPVRKKGRWICEVPSSQIKERENLNKHITDKLEELVGVYKHENDKWRAFQTTKAIRSIKRHPTKITTYEEAKELAFVGDRLANKIDEILSSGDLQRVQGVDKDKKDVTDTFKKIHGVGDVVAEKFYAQGYRTLTDLENSGILNRQQKIGLKHFDDFNERMLREEVSEIEARVRELCESLIKGVEVVTCGSYRRGKPTCGDIDLLITHPDGRSHRGLFDRLLKAGRETEFLTDDLSIHNDPGGQCKYLGVCRLGPTRKFRRIDIILVPYNEFPLALLHFTGSGTYNRSMRNKANQMGMSLSEHGLCTGVIRKKGAKIFDGTPLPVTCEKDVFDYLQMKYEEPTERDHP